MYIAGVCRRVTVGRPLHRLVVEQFDHAATGKIDERRLDRNLRIADDAAEIGSVEHRRPARGLSEKTLPELERNLKAGDSHAYMVDALDRAAVSAISPPHILNSRSALPENIATCSAAEKPEMISA